MKRIFLIVLDSCGVGYEPDADKFGDVGSDTLRRCATSAKFDMTNLVSMGLGNLDGIDYLPKCEKPAAALARLQERSMGKDTTIGHWEIAGVVSENPLPTYPNGFPKDVIDEFSRLTGRKVLCNLPYSGTDVIRDYGREQVETGALIVYTSADSVFQIAAHEDVVPLEELYHCCEIAREILMGDELVGRVIARPFVGGNGKYTRTENRRDYAIPPIGETILDSLSASGYVTAGVGKIEDIFCRRGLGLINHTKNNHDGIEATIDFLKDGKADFIFTNLVDFDMLYGHRNNVTGYAEALEYFDKRLPDIMAQMHEGDLMIITADHGCDPTYPGTDHTREHIPVVVWGPGMKQDVNIGTRKTFADLGCTIVDYLTGKPFKAGESFLGMIR